MSKLIYSQEELEADNVYATPHIECGLKLHGGFNADGEYLSPRTKHRWTAINAWKNQLEKQNVEIVGATTALLTEPNFPNEAQAIFYSKMVFSNHFGTH